MVMTIISGEENDVSSAKSSALKDSYCQPFATSQRGVSAGIICNTEDLLPINEESVTP